MRPKTQWTLIAFFSNFSKSSDTSWHSYDFQTFNVKRRIHLKLKYTCNWRIYCNFIKILDPQILNWKLQFAFRMKINTLSRKSWRKLLAGFLLALPLQHILQDDKMMIFSSLELPSNSWLLYFSPNPTFLLYKSSWLRITNSLM